MHSVITAAVSLENLGGLPEEWQTSMRLCTAPRAVAEVAAVLRMPLTTVVEMFTELVARGLVRHQPPLTERQAADADLLRRIRKGLENL